MPEGPMVSVAVVSWNTRDLTLACLASLANEPSRVTQEVVLVDNASSDGSAAAVSARFPGVRLHRNERNRGFAAACNQAAALSRGSVLCLLNSDTEVRPGALDELVAALDTDPSTAGVAPVLLDPAGRVRRSCRRFPSPAVAFVFGTPLRYLPPASRLLGRYEMADFDHASSASVDQPPAACFALRAVDYRGLGGMDEGLPLYFNDVDLCLRLRRSGGRIRLLSRAAVVHHGGASTRQLTDRGAAWEAGLAAYMLKHHGWRGVAAAHAGRALRRLGRWRRNRAGRGASGARRLAGS